MKYKERELEAMEMAINEAGENCIVPGVREQVVCYVVLERTLKMTTDS